jgi:hypothetical protein
MSRTVMSIVTTSSHRSETVYPDRDGQPVAENTLQFTWIATIKEGLEAQFSNDADVFVAGDLLWYLDLSQQTVRKPSRKCGWPFLGAGVAVSSSGRPG